MRKVMITLKVLALVLVGGLLHYVLPQHDIGRVVDTDTRRVDFTRFNRLFYAQADSGTQEFVNRDVRFIRVIKKKTWLLGFVVRDAEEPMEYRNEDTGWIWPPYFKFDTDNLQTEAADLVSTEENPRWVVITHYGWRNRFFTIYPNAIAIREVDGPDVTIIPWFNIFFFIFLGAAWLFMRAMWRQFRERTIDPALQSAGDKWDKVDARADEARGRFSRWLATWRGKPRG